MMELFALRIVQVDPKEGNIIRSELQAFSLPAGTVNTDSFLDNMLNDLIRSIEQFIKNGSNWIVESVEWFDLRVVRYHSAPNTRGHRFIDLPPCLKGKQACVNVDNQDRNDCFKYAVLSILHYNEITQNRHRVTTYKQWENELKFDGITFPITAGDIPRFERLNPGLYINLLHWDEKNKEHPVRMLRSCGYPKQHPDGIEPRLINVLTYNVGGGGEDAPAHYVGVTNLNRLLNSKGKHQSHEGRKHCERCLQPFTSEELLTNHREYCYTGRPETLVPMNENKQKHIFQRWQSIQRLPYIVYADIECYLEKKGGDDTDYGRVRTHKAAAISYLLIPHPEMKAEPLNLRYRVYQGPDCIVRCMRSLTDLAKEVYQWNISYANQPVIMSSEDTAKHSLATNCYICGKRFASSKKESHNLQKVCEHDHLTGKYRGAACQECNGKMRLQDTFLPVFFHNFRGYDCHIICQEALGEIDGWKVEVIAQTKEKYMSMNAEFCVRPGDEKRKAVYMRIGFRDSFQFMTASLSSLVGNLSADQLKYTRAMFKGDDVAFNRVALGKGVFPYSYFDSPDRLEDRQLPSREDFFDELTQTECSEEKYRSAQEAWSLLKCHTFKDYMLNYLKLDVFQLADVFETFRELTLREDGLDPAYYFTLPGLSWDSAFKMTGISVDLISNADTYCFIEDGIRGGMTFVNEHHAVANNPRIGQVRDDEPLVDLLYVDANNLYGNALSMKLPQSDFQWVDDPDSIDVLNFDYDGDVGHLFEVDLDYPAEIQDKTIDLPFAPEKMTIPESCLTDFMKQQWTALNGGKEKVYRGTSKLMLTHWDKKNYIVHGKLLQFYLRHGLIISKVHRVLQFHQAAFFEPFISYNSKRRAEATNSFEKDYYKLKNNCLFGKTMENVRKR